MDENKETRKGIPPKGCLLMLACIFLGAACIGLSVWLDNIFLKNVTYMATTATASIIADVYFQSKKWVKKYTTWQWIGYVILLLAMAVIFTWIETKNK